MIMRNKSKKCTARINWETSCSNFNRSIQMDGQKDEDGRWSLLNNKIQ